MPRALRIFVPLLIGLAAIVVLCSVGLSLPHSHTQRAIADEELGVAGLNLLNDGRYQDPERVRRASHQVLRMRNGNHHDAFLVLRDCGDLSSVPYLLRSMRWHPAFPDGVMECTTTHGLQALQTITHQDFGLDLNAWEQWWESQRK